MSAADGFVLSSHWEGFGIVVAEAMACELPVVSTACGGPEEIVADGETGYLSEVRDPDQLAANMDTVLEMEDGTRERMGTRGRERIVEAFGIDRIVEQWRAIYSEAGE
ncbi:trehalose synthase [Halalkalicoccus paucihalophilus]|uniref:Trehalose synthase n=1 Tax=Halalkalicoccus paucihalophilus TaxID=1008153 RepID=A0A151ABZ9_9EURY|nr:glycosyltransferase [Halalkalicoccus paucihalophilus]KYH25114.1 trehalose synthase [Halalkalicoccus paucihalophilus]